MPVKKTPKEERRKLPQDSREGKSGSGATKSDFIHDKADSVRSGSGLNVRVTYKGNTYDAQLAFGDANRCTVLVQLKNKKWAKLWFKEEDLY